MGGAHKGTAEIGKRTTIRFCPSYCYWKLKQPFHNSKTEEGNNRLNAGRIKRTEREQQGFLVSIHAFAPSVFHIQTDNNKNNSKVFLSDALAVGRFISDSSDP